MQRGKKAADKQVREGKNRHCQHPQCAEGSSPLPAPLSWVRKQEWKVDQKPVVQHALGEVTATQLPSKDLLANSALRNMLERLGESWTQFEETALCLLG